LRGRYMSPAFAVKIGETAIRNCFRDQLSAIRKEGLDYMGNHPCVLTEFGIPYDMDDRYAYKTGDYSSQSGAMDANHFAIEGSSMAGYTLWLYMCEVSYLAMKPWTSPNRSRTNIISVINGTEKICPFSLWMIVLFHSLQFPLLLQMNPALVLFRNPGPVRRKSSLTSRL
jgi:hypothetical protein